LAVSAEASQAAEAQAEAGRLQSKIALKKEVCMKKGCLVGIIIVVVIVGCIGFFIGGLNKVVKMDENVKAAWAQVENQLQRRNDLIYN